MFARRRLGAFMAGSVPSYTTQQRWTATAAPRVVGAPSSAPATNSLAQLDGDDIFDLCTTVFKSTAYEPGEEALEELKRLVPVLPRVTAVQAANLAVGPWPTKWGSGGDNATTHHFQAMNTLRTLIHDEAPGLTGSEAALVLVILNNRAQATAFRANLFSHEKELVAELARNSANRNEVKKVFPKHGSYLRAYFSRLLKVVIYHINDLKETNLLLNLCATVKKMVRDDGFVVPSGFWELMLRRILAHNCLYRLTNEQHYRALRAVAEYTQNKVALLAIINGIVSNTTTSLLSTKRAELGVADKAKDDDDTHSTLTPTQTFATWEEACANLVKHAGLSPKQFLNLLEWTAREIPRTHFRMFYPLLSDIIVPLVKTANATILSRFVTIYLSANVRNELALVAAMERCVELHKSRNAPAVDSSTKLPRHLGVLEPRDYVTLLDLLSVSPHVLKGGAEIVAPFIQLALGVLRRYVNNLSNEMLVFLAELVGKLCRGCKEYEKNIKKLLEAPASLGEASIAQDIQLERMHSQIVQPLKEFLTEGIVSRAMKLYHHSILPMRDAEKILDVTLMLEVRDTPAAKCLLTEFRDRHDRIVQREKDGRKAVPWTTRPPSRGATLLFSALLPYCLQMEVSGEQLPKAEYNRFQGLVCDYPCNDVLEAALLRFQTAIPVKGKHEGGISMRSMLPPVFMAALISRSLIQAAAFASEYRTKNYPNKKARRFLELVQDLKKESHEFADRLENNEAFQGLFEMMKKRHQSPAPSSSPASAPAEDTASTPAAGETPTASSEGEESTPSKEATVEVEGSKNEGSEAAAEAAEGSSASTEQ